VPNCTQRRLTSLKSDSSARRHWDITIEADIIEEVARIYGYDRLPSTLPQGETVAGHLTKAQRLTREVRTLLEGNGVSEAISYALTTEEKAQQFTDKSSQVTRLDWPMTEERPLLKRLWSLFP